MLVKITAVSKPGIWYTHRIDEVFDIDQHNYTTGTMKAIIHPQDYEPVAPDYPKPVVPDYIPADRASKKKRNLFCKKCVFLDII